MIPLDSKYKNKGKDQILFSEISSLPNFYWWSWEELERDNSYYHLFETGTNGITNYQYNYSSSAIFHYGISGTGYLQMPDKLYTISPGQLFIVICPNRYAFGPDRLKCDKWENIGLNITNGLPVRIAIDLVNKYGPVYTLSDNNSAIIELCRFIEHSEKGDVTDAESLLEFTLPMLTSLTRQFGHNKQQVRTTILNVLSYININYAEDLTINQMADFASLSPAYFIRLFTTEMGYSPMQFLSRLRLQNAFIYLCNSTDDSVKNIALKTGFKHVESLYAVCQRILHNSPANIRKLRWEDIFKMIWLQPLPKNVEFLYKK